MNSEAQNQPPCWAVENLVDKWFPALSPPDVHGLQLPETYYHQLCWPGFLGVENPWCRVLTYTIHEFMYCENEWGNCFRTLDRSVEVTNTFITFYEEVVGTSLLLTPFTEKREEQDAVHEAAIFGSYGLRVKKINEMKVLSSAIFCLPNSQPDASGKAIRWTPWPQHPPTSTPQKLVFRGTLSLKLNEVSSHLASHGRPPSPVYICLIPSLFKAVQVSDHVQAIASCQ